MLRAAVDKELTSENLDLSVLIATFMARDGLSLSVLAVSGVAITVITENSCKYHLELSQNAMKTKNFDSCQTLGNHFSFLRGIPYAQCLGFSDHTCFLL